MCRNFRNVMIGCLIILFAVVNALAQDEDKSAPAKAGDGGDLRAAVQNPVGAMYSLPFKFTFDYGAPNGEASFLNIQPVSYTHLTLPTMQ